MGGPARNVTTISERTAAVETPAIIIVTKIGIGMLRTEVAHANSASMTPSRKTSMTPSRKTSALLTGKLHVPELLGHLLPTMLPSCIL